MRKHIINFCPACDKNDECLGQCDGVKCADNYCVFKQIVEKCKDKMDNEFNSASVFAQEVLDLLDINEVLGAEE